MPTQIRFKVFINVAQNPLPKKLSSTVFSRRYIVLIKVRFATIFQKTRACIPTMHAFQLSIFPVLICKTIKSILLTLFRMDLFGALHGWGGKKAPLPKICHTYPTIMKLGIYTLPKEDSGNI